MNDHRGATLSAELATVTADYPRWHGWISDEGRMYAVRPTRHSGLTAFGGTGERLRQSIAEAEYDLAWAGAA